MGSSDRRLRFYPTLRAVAAALAVLGLSACRSDAPVIYPDGKARAAFGDMTVVLDIARTDAERERGLMFRKSLAAAEGMIFVFDQPGFYPFWMRNCLIPLDLIWLDREFRIVSIAGSVPPCRLAGCPPPCASFECPSYAPTAGTTALYVVELQAGFAGAHGVKVGDRVAVSGLGVD